MPKPQIHRQQSPRIWIEFERYEKREDRERAVQLANKIMRKLGIPEGSGEFYWSEKDNQYWWTTPTGYTTLPDRGHWFNLDYLAK